MELIKAISKLLSKTKTDVVIVSISGGKSNSHRESLYSIKKKICGFNNQVAFKLEVMS